MFRNLISSAGSIILAIEIIVILLSSCKSHDFINSDWELVVDNQKFPEGITWEPSGKLYSSNCNGNWITRITNDIVDTFLIASDSTFVKTNGLLALKDGSLLACDFGNGTIIKFNKNGNRKIIIPGYKGKPFNRPNDLTIDREGNLFFTDPKSYGKDKLDGRIFYYTFNNKQLTLLQDSLAFPNGIGISPIDGKLYVCESAKSRILSFEISNDYKLIDKQVFIELPGGDPDGFNFDVNGNMYVAHFGGGAVYIISPEGNILSKIKTPGKKPSNVEFAGSERKILYITEDETNSIYKMKVSVAGFKF